MKDKISLIQGRLELVVVQNGLPAMCHHLSSVTYHSNTCSSTGTYIYIFYAMSEYDDTELAALIDSDALPVPRALQLPEVLNNIFAYCSAAVLVNCALISRLWSDIALDHIWRNNPPFMELIKLLAPLRSSPSEMTYNRKRTISTHSMVSSSLIPFWCLTLRSVAGIRACDYGRRLEAL